jgi:hypothetical protein
MSFCWQILILKLDWIWMKFLGFVHFVALKMLFDKKKTVVARENSANFDYFTKTAHFQPFLRIFKNYII